MKEKTAYHVRDFLHLYDVEFVNAAYEALLKRKPDHDGERYYLERLRNGVSRKRLLIQMVKSEEARNKKSIIHGLLLSLLEDKLHNILHSNTLPSYASRLLRGMAAAKPEIIIVQCDNRPINLKYLSKKLIFDEFQDSEFMIRSMNGQISSQTDFWSMTSAINRIKARLIGARYVHVATDEAHFPDRKITWNKMLILRQILVDARPDNMICFLDSDAWIRDERAFLNIVSALRNNPDKHIALSRDPKIEKNSFVNSGCLIIKNTPYSLKLLERVWNAVETDQYDRYRFVWPHEQYVLSDFVISDPDKFFVLKVNILNTPCGEVVRHVWWKQMLPELLDDVCRECMFKLTEPAYGPAEVVEQFDINDYLDDGRLG